MVIEPIKDGVVFFFVEIDLNGFERLHVKNVVTVIKRGLFVVEGWETHSFKMASVAFFSAHHDPHGAPLGCVDRLDNFGGLIDKGNRTRNVIQDFYSAFLFPRHRHVLHQLKNSMGNVLQRAQINSFVLPESFARHIAMILHNFSKRDKM